MSNQSEKELMQRIQELENQLKKNGLEPVASTSKKKKKKGVAICSETIRTDDFQAPVFPKGEDTKLLIHGAMLASSIFKNLSAEQLESVIDAMYPMQHKTGGEIIKAETAAENFYVVDSGKCDVFVKKEFSNTEELVLTIGEGASFGEIALMYECDYNITVKAHDEVTVWTIDRKSFRSIVVSTTNKKRKQYESTLNKVELFNKLTQTEKSLMADALEEITFTNKQEIIRYGEVGDSFYICIKGKVEVYSNEGKLLAERTVGDYFGEKALLEGDRRMATIVAKGTAIVGRIDEDTFTRLLGPLKDVLAFREYGAGGVEVKKDPKKEAEKSATAVETPKHWEFGGPNATSNPPMERSMFEKRGIVLGIGAFGYVQLVRHLQTKKVYALKTLTKKSILKTDQLHHVKDEILNLHECMNPFIVNLFSCFSDDMHVYMVMEYVSGGELYSIIQNHQVLRDADARFIAAEIILAMEYCHNKKIIYRDLKPENVLVDGKGHVKITDFGLSKKVQSRTFTLCGTPDYISPEIIQNRGHNKGADYWAIGIIIYEMLSGLPPFYKENEDHTTFDRILANRYGFPRGINPDAKDLIKNLLQPDMTKRYGCINGGSEVVKKHPWFSKTNWQDMVDRVKDGPFKPRLRSEDDTSAFDDYTGASLPKGKPLTAQAAQKFADYPFF